MPKEIYLDCKFITDTQSNMVYKSKADTFIKVVQNRQKPVILTV